jgi:REP element-mobilizing transposase RayT
MVHGYHVIMGLYGFWLPNDPRGSWSDFVGAWELLRFGTTTRSIDRKSLLTPEEERQRQEAKQFLKYPPVSLTGLQALAVAQGFAAAAKKCRLTIWACSILPEHVHLVIGRHRYEVERIANLLKGEATKELRRRNLDPMSVYARAGKRPRSPWARGAWKVFLDTEEAIENAIYYVDENPSKEGKRRQQWSFIEPFRGLDKAGIVTYYP